MILRNMKQLKFRKMESSSNSATTQEHTYSFDFGCKGNLLTKNVVEVFMVDYNQIVAHTSHRNTQYLIYINFSGQKIQCPLQSRPLVQQLNRYEFIVLNRKNYSVDKITFVNKQWKVQCIRTPQSNHSRQYDQTLFLFKLTNSFCIIDSIGEKNVVCYYKQKQKEGPLLKIFEMTMEYKQLFKINEKGKIGWIEYRKPTKIHSYQINFYQATRQEQIILHYIDFESSNFKFIGKQVKGYHKYLEQFKWGRLTIQQMVELFPDVYICNSSQMDPYQYWLYDTRNSDKFCMKPLKINREHNLPLFSYHSDRFKILGSFGVLAQHQFAPSISNYINNTNHEQSISIVQSVYPLKYNPRICMYSYIWQLIRAKQKGFLEIKVTTKGNNFKEMLICMLLHFNQDFDDDLLQDVIELTAVE